MTREEFDDLVREVEQGIGRRPTALKWRVGFLAAVGYAGLLAWLVAILVIAGAFFAAMYWADLEGKIVCALLGAVILFGGGYAALRALLVQLPAPEGRAITRAEAPVLFAELDDLQLQLQSSPFHKVLLDTDCNAGVVQVPRLGVLGWPRNYLIIGLPLLDGMSREEVRAVLAHEFAHLSRQHGRFSHWLYRLRRSWEEVFKRLSSPQAGGEVSMRPLTVKFVDWFWPRFNAHAFVLSRSNEFEADAQAARLAGIQHSASALARLAIVSRQLEHNFWKGIWLEANERAEPPGDVFRRLHAVLRTGPAPAERSKWLGEAFQIKTTNSDTHPCLTERLQAMNISPDMVLKSDSLQVPPRVCASESLLGPALAGLREEVQSLWQRQTGEFWKQRHDRAASLSHRLDSLEAAVTPAAAIADADALWDRANVMLGLEGDQGATPLLRQILTLRPNHVAANFHLGRILLVDGNTEGEPFLERAMAEDEQTVHQACGILYEHYRRSGRTDKQRETAARLDRYEKEFAASQAERREVSAKDTLIPHGLSEPELAELRAILAAEPELCRAVLGRKELKHFPKQKLFLLCAHRVRPWHCLPDRDRDQALVNRLMQAVRLPGRLLVFAPSGSFRGTARKLRELAGAEVFQCDR